MSDNMIEELYKKVDHLIRHCEQLELNNELLQSREKLLLQEQTRLIENNELAKTRIEAMIGHLKDLQQSTT